MEDTKITMYDDDGTPAEFYVIEQTKVSGVSYLLVTEKISEETEAYILKDVSDEKDEDAVYEFVDEDSEIEYIGRIFAELLDDEDTALS